MYSRPPVEEPVQGLPAVEEPPPVEEPVEEPVEGLPAVENLTTMNVYSLLDLRKRRKRSFCPACFMAMARRTCPKGIGSRVRDGLITLKRRGVWTSL